MKIIHCSLTESNYCSYLGEEQKCLSPDNPGTCEHMIYQTGIPWISFAKKLPGAGQPILVYRKTKNPQTMFHTLLYWSGDEHDYTHWVSLTIPDGEKS